MNGILYGVGAGPGDPELMTLKAVRMIQEKEIIAVAGARAEESVAYQIAIQVVPELMTKTVIALNMPMTMDKKILEESHNHAALEIEKYLKKGQDVVYLTLGDPTVYSTFYYVQRIVEDHGFNTVIVSGVTSFCAAAATKGEPLVIKQEALHILPAIPTVENSIPETGTVVLMKSGSKIKQVKELLHKEKREKAKVFAVENCGMKNEKIYPSIEEIPDDAGYYSLIVVKN